MYKINQILALNNSVVEQINQTKSIELFHVGY